MTITFLVVATIRDVLNLIEMWVDAKEKNKQNILTACPVHFGQMFLLSGSYEQSCSIYFVHIFWFIYVLPILSINFGSYQFCLFHPQILVYVCSVHRFWFLSILYVPSIDFDSCQFYQFYLFHPQISFSVCSIHYVSSSTLSQGLDNCLVCLINSLLFIYCIIWNQDNIYVWHLYTQTTDDLLACCIWVQVSPVVGVIPRAMM